MIGDEGIPNTSEDDKVELSQLAGVALDFIAGVPRQSKSKKWFTQEHLRALVNAVVPWAEIASDDVSTKGNEGRVMPLIIAHFLLDAVGFLAGPLLF